MQIPKQSTTAEQQTNKPITEVNKAITAANTIQQSTTQASKTIRNKM